MVSSYGKKHNLLQPASVGRLSPYWRTFLLCLLTALLIFLPFQIIDGGMFHYAGDFNSQQITFWRYMNQFVKQGGTFAWSADLGSGAANAYSFYLLGSPFFWLSLIFPANWMPYLMCPLLALKFGVAGGGAYLYLKRYAKTPNMAMIGACLYAFSGFAVYSTFFNHFVDVVALFPYLLWALDEAVYEGRRGLFALAAALNLLTNYFFFAGQILFLVIYFVCKLLSKEYKLTKKLFCVLAFESILAAAMGCVLAWPAVLSLAQNPRTVDLSSGWGFLTYGKVQQYLAILLSWIMPPDSPYLMSIWNEGTIKWTNMTAYLPLCSLAGVISYWKARHGSSVKKILGTSALFALVPVLNSAFYCLNSSYYARWFYMPVLIMALATMQVLQDDTIPIEPGVAFVGIVMSATLVFAVIPVHSGEDDTWSLGVLNNEGQYFAVLLLGLAGLLIYYLLTDAWRGKKGFAKRMLAAVLAFSCFYSIVHIGIGKFGQWSTDSNLVAQYQGALALKEALPEGSYRVDTYQCHDNLGPWLEKSSLEYFGSTVAPSLLEFYPDVGVKRDVRSEPDIGLYALRGLLSVEYMLVPEDEMSAFEEKADAGWAPAGIAEGGFVLYHNLNYVPFGFTYDSYLTETQFKSVMDADRGNLLMRGLLLDEEQIAKYGDTLTMLTDADLQTLDYDTYAADAAARRENACSSFTMTNTGFDATITLDKGNLVFFSVPWDEGFTATVNGEAAEIEKVDHGMMAVWCPAGENEITFTFHTAGLSLSGKICAAGVVLYLGYLGAYAWQRKKRGALAAAPAQEKKAGGPAEALPAAPKADETPSGPADVPAQNAAPKTKTGNGENIE
ncbi:MAG: YfhO family protein [Faecalibacterium sp.]|nr:YfhO family protein [Faecalibacterium sp.]